MKKIVIIGAGNISNTRHIPAIKKLKDVEIIGIIGNREKNVFNTAKRINVKNTLIFSGNSYYEEMKKCDWLEDADAVIIGAPPKEHYKLVEASLKIGKNVLVEKPMTMNVEEAKELIELSKKMKKRFCVMHNFQYSNGILKMEKVIKKGELGNIKSICEFQFTNRNRRLPQWYNDLPLGLFYDEAAHFIYLLEKFGGKIKVDNAYAYFNKDKTDKTPILLNASMTAGKYPVHLLINFNSPICEWYFMICGEKKIAVYDFFKDILMVIPTDDEHKAMNILKTSWRVTIQHWFNFAKNGFKMVSGNLLYGHDVVIYNFLKSIDNDYQDENIDCTKGYENVKCMNEIIDIISNN